MIGALWGGEGGGRDGVGSWYGRGVENEKVGDEGRQCIWYLRELRRGSQRVLCGTCQS